MKMKMKMKIDVVGWEWSVTESISDAWHLLVKGGEEGRRGRRRWRVPRESC